MVSWASVNCSLIRCKSGSPLISGSASNKLFSVAAINFKRALSASEIASSLSVKFDGSSASFAASISGSISLFSAAALFSDAEISSTMATGEAV